MLQELKKKQKKSLRGSKPAPPGPVGSDIAFLPSPPTSHLTTQPSPLCRTHICTSKSHLKSNHSTYPIKPKPEFWATSQPQIRLLNRAPKHETRNLNMFPTSHLTPQPTFSAETTQVTHFAASYLTPQPTPFSRNRIFEPLSNLASDPSTYPL